MIRDTDAGKVVTCLALADEHERGALAISDSNGQVWRIDRDCMWADWTEDGREKPLPYCPDSALTPIRPGEEHVESAQDAGVVAVV